MPTLHVIIPNILSRSGHNYQVTLNVCAVASHRGWATAVHLPRKVSDREMIEDLRAVCDIEHCTTSIFDDPLVEIGAANQRSYDDLITILDDIAPDDFIYLTMLHHRNMFGLMRAFDERYGTGPMPQLCIQLWSQQCFVDGGTEIHRRNSDFFARFLAWCAARRNRCSPVWAFSPAHMEHLESLGGGAAGVTPIGHVMAPMPPEIEPSRSPEGSFRFGYFGVSVVPDKGLEQWLGAARIVADRLPEARFTFQLAFDVARWDHAGLLERHADFLADPRVHRLGPNLTQHDYFSAMAVCEAIILPYGPLYERQESGISHEAARLGKPIVAPERSIATWRLRQAGATLPTFASWTSEAIAEACLALHAEYEEIAAAVSRAEPVVNRGTTAEEMVDEMGLLPVAADRSGTL